MTDAQTLLLLHRLVGGDFDAADAVLSQAATTDSASVLVAAAMLSRDLHHLTRATALATSARERQLVVLADAHLHGNNDLLDVLVRDHLAEHPDHLLAAWIAGRPAAGQLEAQPTKEKAMSHVIPAPPAAPTTTTTRTVVRWMVSFTGFPLGGLAALILTGPVDSIGKAVAGGLITGAVLGAVQSWALRSDRRQLMAWTLATALGLAAGLALGASLVGFGTGMGDLAVQGAVTGAVVGLSQAVVLRPRTGLVAFVWPLYLAGVWALGWVVTTAGGISVEEQFTTFGSYGALTVALLTSVLPVFFATNTEKSSS